MILTLLMTGTAAVFAAALAMLVMWQDWRRRSNQYFALTMLFFLANTGSNFLFRFNYLLHLSAESVLYLSTTFYAGTVLSLFVFELNFARVRREWRRPLGAIGLVFFVLFTSLMWLGHVFTDITEPADHAIHYGLTALGNVVLFMLTTIPLLTIGALSRTRTRRAQTLWPISVLQPIAVVLSAVPALESYPINATALLIIALVAGQLVIREHVTRPLHKLNRQLAATNDELAQATQLKSQFLANMSHELRTPLNSVIGYTDLVSSGLYGPLTAKQADRLDKIGRNGRQLLALINDVLDLSKIEAGHMKLFREPLNLTNTFGVALDAVRAQASAKGLSLSATCDSDLPPVFADAPRLDQILSNLLTNAVKFTPTGGVTVRATRDHGIVLISVADTGIGISEERQIAIFEMFSSADAIRPADDSANESTGLGLAIARHLVQMHGGRIWLASDGVPGNGTTFYFTIPVAAGELAPIKPRTGLLGPTVLCIDDNHEALEVYQGLLESEGYRVYGAQGGSAGLRRVRELTPDVILLDVMMPGLDSWQVMAALRAEPRSARAPVIVISSPDQGGSAQELGAAGYLVKPIQRSELLTQIRAALEGEAQHT